MPFVCRSVKADGRRLLLTKNENFSDSENFEEKNLENLQKIFVTLIFGMNEISKNSNEMFENLVAEANSVQERTQKLEKTLNRLRKMSEKLKSQKISASDLKFREFFWRRKNFSTSPPLDFDLFSPKTRPPFVNAVYEAADPIGTFNRICYQNRSGMIKFCQKCQKEDSSCQTDSMSVDSGVIANQDSPPAVELSDSKSAAVWSRENVTTLNEMSRLNVELVKIDVSGKAFRRMPTCRQASEKNGEATIKKNSGAGGPGEAEGPGGDDRNRNQKQEKKRRKRRNCEAAKKSIVVASKFFGDRQRKF